MVDCDTCSRIGVAMTAGETQLTFIPYSVTSFAKAFVRQMTPALDAEYGMSVGFPVLARNRGDTYNLAVLSLDHVVDYRFAAEEHPL